MQDSKIQPNTNLSNHNERNQSERRVNQSINKTVNQWFSSRCQWFDTSLLNLHWNRLRRYAHSPETAVWARIELLELSNCIGNRFFNESFVSVAALLPTIINQSIKRSKKKCVHVRVIWVFLFLARQVKSAVSTYYIAFSLIASRSS
jgi:hypothetical protein